MEEHQRYLRCETFLLEPSQNQGFHLHSATFHPISVWLYCNCHQGVCSEAEDRKGPKPAKLSTCIQLPLSRLLSLKLIFLFGEVRWRLLWQGWALLLSSALEYWVTFSSALGSTLKWSICNYKGDNRPKIMGYPGWCKKGCKRKEIVWTKNANRMLKVNCHCQQQKWKSALTFTIYLTNASA